jgi:hypothetical protein
MGAFRVWGWVIGTIGVVGTCVSAHNGQSCLGQEPSEPSVGQAADRNGRVRIVDNRQAETTGRLVAADEAGIEYVADQLNAKRTAEELVRVEFAPQRANAAEAMVLTLVDGSRFYGSQLVGKEQGWQFSDTAGVSIGLGAGVVEAVQVRALAGDLKTAWEAAVAERIESDSLIVLRPGNTLDRVSGLIREVKEDKVVFDVDGQIVEVALAKLAGMIWFRKPLDKIKPTIAIQMTDGGVAYAETFRWTPERVEVQGILGEGFSFPTKRLAAIDYSHANLRWLSAVASLESKSDKRMDWKWESNSLERALAPRMVRRRTDTESMAEDLLFPGPGSYVFRVPEGFTRLVSKIERTGGGAQQSPVTVEVWQDDVRVFEKSMSFTDEVLELDVPLAANKKVRLSVLSPGRLMIGTELRWNEPRLVR